MTNVVRPVATFTSTLDDLFEDVAQRHAMRIALADGSRSLTYSDVLDNARALADELSLLGISEGDVVSIVGDRSIDFVIAILGIIRTGAAYLPLPGDFPPRRVAELVADARAAAAVFLGAAGPHGRELHGKRHALQTVPGEARTFGGRGTVPIPQGERLAYVMYTSGSSGKPKGVLVTHRNVVQLVVGQTYVSFGPEETFLHLSHVAFDATTFEVWGALLSGARLCVAPPTAAVLSELPDLLQSFGIGTLFVTTPLFHELFDHVPTAFDSVAQLLIGGEPLSVDRALRLMERRPADAITSNVYGPTETTTFATAYPLRHLTQRDDRVPIGWPLAHTEIRVVNDRMEEVRDGEVGEIWIGGVGVSAGYLNRNELTESLFVDDPRRPGYRLYRSGDLGLRRSDGAIEFRGRADKQVKVRGFRIEPEEVEQALVNHPEVAAAAVVAAERLGRKELVAYYVPRGSDAEGLEERLRTHLGSVLPPFMVPGTFHEVEEMPLTAAGKLDRSSERLQQTQPESAEDCNNVENEVEARIIELWKRVLGLERVGLDDDFFSLGGDSLLVLRLIGEAQEEGVDLTSADVFGNPTVRLLAASRGGRETEVMAAPPEPAPELTEASAYPATQMQLGMIFEGEASEDGSLYHDGILVPVYARLAEEPLRRAIAMVEERHDALRTHFDLANPGGPMQVVSAEAAIPVSVHDFRDSDANEKDRALQGLLEHLMRPFDIETGPLLRVAAVATDDDAFALLFAFHHAIMDGWSESLFLSEFLACYEAFVAGGQPDLPDLEGLRYRELARLEQRALNSTETNAYWRRLCDRSRACLLAREDAEPSTARTRVAAELPADLSRALHVCAAERRVAVKTILLAGHLVVIANELGTTQPLSGFVVNGRPERKGGDRLIGLFLNVLPVSVDLAGASWPRVVELVARAETELLPHRWFPYQAVHRLSGGRPLFDVAFNFVRFHVYSEIASKRTIKLGDHTISDKTSVPLMADFVADPQGPGLRLELTGDSSSWDAGRLQALHDTYRAVYEQLVDDPSSVPRLPRVADR